jgi:enolase-phosphatase E1
MIKYVLMDIEGTTTPITFVHDVLFPYSKAHLAAYVAAHADEPDVRSALEGTKRTAAEESGRRLNDAEAVQQLLAWIDADRKHPALKALQGMIWEDGYGTGAYTSEVYPEVRPCLERWKERGITLGIYSSGSVQAQKLLFKYTPVGDVTPLLSHYFDTGVGGKREADSYRRILAEIKVEAGAVLFLSDVPEELDAAAVSGMQTAQLLRPGTKAGGTHKRAADFGEVERLFGIGDT